MMTDSTTKTTHHDTAYYTTDDYGTVYIHDPAYYIAWGDIRGECGHQHPDVEDAERCAEADSAAVKAAPGATGAYSDRGPYAVFSDGTFGPLSTGENDWLASRPEPTPTGDGGGWD